MTNFMDDLYLFSLWSASYLCSNNGFSFKIDKALVVGYVISIVGSLPQPGRSMAFFTSFGNWDPFTIVIF